MSLFTPKKTVIASKVHNSQYIRTENSANEDGTTLVEPVVPESETK